MFSQLCIFVLKLRLIIKIKIVLAMLLDSFWRAYAFVYWNGFKKENNKTSGSNVLK